MSNTAAALLDMTNLRDMIDHDADVERELIQNFYDNAGTCFDNFEASLLRNDPDLWHDTAHAMKGIAFNIGAYQLGELCRSAEQVSNEAHEVKVALLEIIKSNYTHVDAALKQQ